MNFDQYIEFKVDEKLRQLYSYITLTNHLWSIPMPVFLKFYESLDDDYINLNNSLGAVIEGEIMSSNLISYLKETNRETVRKNVSNEIFKSLDALI